VIVDGHTRQFRHQPKVAADQTLDQARMSETIEPPVQAVARCGCEYQREVAGFSRLNKTPLQRPDDFVRGADTHEAGRGDRVAGPDNGDRFRGIDDLVAHQVSLADLASRANSQSAMLLLSLPCDLLETKSPTCPPGRGISV